MRDLEKGGTQIDNRITMPCNFFLWGWAKENAYRRKPKTIDQLEQAIRDALYISNGAIYLANLCQRVQRDFKAPIILMALN